MDMNLITCLPYEILPTVLGFLSLGDRKNARLTCRSFKEACDRTAIIKREKFVFHFGFVAKTADGLHLARHIGECEHLRSTVEFRSIGLAQLPLSIWATLSDRITSLFIDHCLVDDEIMAEIFLRCSELVDIHLDVVSKAKLFGNGSTSLDELIALGVERPKLRSFKLFTSRSLSDDAFRKIFKIFPNIRTFGRDHYYQSSFGSLRSPFRFRHDQRSISAPIELPASVEHFIYNMNANSSWMVPYIRHPTLKFKKLEFTLTILNDQGMHNITEFFSSQIEVERLDLRVLTGRSQPYLAKSILFLVLRKSRKLEALKFHIDCEMKFSNLEFAELLATIRNLKSLDLSFKRCFHDPLTSRHELPSIEYCKLAHLKLNFECASVTQLQSEIFSRCRSLQSLSLGNVDDETMKLIFRYHTKLKALILNCSGWRGVADWEGYSFDRLQKLEYLNLRNLVSNVINDCPLCADENCCYEPDESDSFVALISTLDCPMLKVFIFEETRCSMGYLSQKNTIDVLRILAQRSPLLETLKLHSNLSIEECHAHCRNMKNLRHLAVRSPYNENLSLAETDVNYHQLFNSCPSLTYIVEDRQYPESYAIFYERKTESLVIHSEKSAELLCERLNIPAYKFK